MLLKNSKKTPHSFIISIFILIFAKHRIILGTLRFHGTTWIILELKRLKTKNK